MTPEGDSAYARPGRATAWMRLPRVLLIGLSLVGMGIAGALLWSQQARVQTMDSAMRALQGQLRQAQDEAESLKTQLADQEAARRSLTDQLSAAQRQAAQAHQAVAALQQQQDDAEVRSAALQGEKEALAAQVAGAIKEREEARRQVTSLLAGKNDLEGRYRALEQRYASLARGGQPPQAGRAPAAGGATGVIELPPIVVQHPASSPSSTASATGAAARIVDVNERYRFVVINQGSAEGIEPGMIFDIIRNGRSIGQTTVRQVREHLSACDAESSGETALPFQIGDAAVLQHG